jgi:serpin B
MNKLWLSGLMVALVSGLVACTQPVSGEVLRSEKQRVTSPDVSKADLATLVDGNSAFALDLYQAIKERGGNLFYSPYSISLALTMTYAGARGETEQQMADTLCFVLPQDRLHPAFNSLDIELSRRGEGAKGKDEKGFRLNIVNAIWGQKVMVTRQSNYPMTVVRSRW